MPSNNYWTSAASGDLDTIGNYSNGAKPGTGDSMFFNNVLAPIDTHTDQTGATGKDVLVFIGPNAVAAIGTLAAPLAYGNAAGAGTIDVDAPQCPAIYYTAATVARANIHRCSNGTYGFTHVAGVIAEMNCENGSVRISAAADVTILNLLAGAEMLTVTLESGADILTHLRQSSGLVINQTDIPLIYLEGGVFRHEATSGLTLGTVDIRGAGVLEWNATAGTVTALTIGAGGKCDFSKCGNPYTVTNASVYKGGVLDAGTLGVGTWTNNVINYGGTIYGVPMSKITTAVSAPPSLPR
jgi:hypothetical protein